MTVLQRVLRAQVAVWTIAGLAIVAAPRWILVSIFNQVPYPDYTYVRVSGAMAIGFSMLAVLVARRADDIWWWAWAFAITDVAVATITATNAVFGRPEGSSALLWWLFAGLNAALASGLLVGLARTGEDKPFV